MKKYTFTVIGLSIILLGVGMFVFGASMFTYQGKELNPIVSKLGMYSFFFWLPTIAVGILVMLYSKRLFKTYFTTHT